MTVLSDFSEELLLEYLFTTIAAADRPTTWWLSLHTDAPGETGVDNEMDTDDDADYTGAVRPEIEFTKLANNSVDNDDNITYSTTDGTASVAITHIGIWGGAAGETVGSGTYLAGGALDGTRTLTSTAPFTIAAGDLVIALN